MRRALAVGLLVLGAVLAAGVAPERVQLRAGIGDGENESPGAHFPRLNVGGYLVGAVVLALLALLLARRLRRRPA